MFVCVCGEGGVGGGREVEGGREREETDRQTERIVKDKIN